MLPVRSRLSWENKRHPGPTLCGAGVMELRTASDLCDVGGLKTLGSLDHLKLDLIAFVQGLVAVADNGLEVHEHVFAAFARNEAEALRGVEPLDGSLYHG